MSEVPLYADNGDVACGVCGLGVRLWGLDLTVGRNTQTCATASSSSLSGGDHTASLLTQCIRQLVLESQLHHTTVKSILQLVIANNKLMMLWGSSLSKTN